ncbi:MAG TPA: hypothetical protein VGD78_08690, partial [Chthoniobacterales bacterium]
PGSAIRAARWATVVFGLLMVGVATLAANAVLHDAKLTIIPIALGSLGYTYGSLLGVFLVGLLTRTRGRDETNVLAMLAGMAAVLVACRVKLPAFDVVALVMRGTWRDQVLDFGHFLPVWWPTVAFPWYVLTGCAACAAVSIIFRTPAERLRQTAHRREGLEEAAVE